MTRFNWPAPYLPIVPFMSSRPVLELDKHVENDGRGDYRSRRPLPTERDHGGSVSLAASLHKSDAGVRLVYTPRFESIVIAQRSVT